MKSIRNEHELKETIRTFSIQCDEEKDILKQNFHLAYANLKPINLVKHAIKAMIESKELKQNALDYAIGISSGFMTKKLVQGGLHHPLKKILGTILQIGVTQFVYKNPQKVKSAGFGLMKFLIPPSKTGMKKISGTDRRIDDALFMDV